MKWIAVKHPIVYAMAIDGHQITAPNFPTMSPAPTWPHFMLHHIPYGEYITGVWTDASSMAQNLGVCLWQHDWGIGQIHVAVPVCWWLPMIPLGSTLKLQLPSSSQKLRVTGGAVAAGSEAPPAPAFPNGFIICQSCWDRGGFSFVLPTGAHFSTVCNVFLDVRLGDIFAAVLSMASNALASMAGSRFGQRFNGYAGWAIGQLMGTFGRSKAAVALFLGLPLGLWDGLMARRGVSQAVRARGGGSAGLSGSFFIFILGSVACDMAAERVQGWGPTIGESAPAETSPSPQ